MIRYCEKCRDFHEENALCPKYKELLKQHKEWLGETATFATVAAQYQLITSQSLNTIAQAVNKIAGTNLSYEGTHQVARDIHVFAKLNSDSFRNSGQFANAQTAKETLSNASDGFERYLRGRLNGTGQEIDWLEWRNGKLDNLLYKYQLPDGNTVGYDGIKVNRFTGKTVERITIKAAEGQSGLHTNAVDIAEALEKGTLSPNDSVFGIEGLEKEIQKVLDKKIQFAQEQGNTDLVKKLQDARQNLKIKEIGSTDTVKESTERLTQKIQDGKANTTITGSELGSKMAHGAVIGAAVALTISSITNYIKFKNGEISEEEAFRNVGEDTTKGLITGGSMAGITLFLPGGPVGFIAGMAIGIYINAVCTNVLDEVFGKGAYEQILHSCGYVSGTAKNVEEMLRKYQNHMRRIDRNLNQMATRKLEIQRNLEQSENLIALAEKRLGE